MVLNNPVDDNGDHYLCYGLNKYQETGYIVAHNLETPQRSSRIVHFISFVMNRSLNLVGGIGGDFRSVIANRGKINNSDMVISTVDTLGLPLVLFKASRLIHTPAAYISIGLPERLARLKNDRMRRWYRQMFSSIETVISYGHEEHRILKRWLNPDVCGQRVRFVPFGVDVDYFKPDREKTKKVDILSVGADAHRDFDMVVSAAIEMPEKTFEIITSAEHSQLLKEVPCNIRVVCDISIAKLRTHMASAKIVVLPIRENSYSGATTTLLQAMAMEKPVVVSRVGAIKYGYYLKDGYNCMFAEPGNKNEFVKKVTLLLNGKELQCTIAHNARKTVAQKLSWNHYVQNMQSIFKRMAVQNTITIP